MRSGPLRLRYATTLPNRTMTPHLPDELIELIVLQLITSPELSQKDVTSNLARFSLVSTQTYRVVQPYLYTHIHGGRKGGHVSLIRTLLHNHTLSAYAHS